MTRAAASLLALVALCATPSVAEDLSGGGLQLSANAGLISVDWKDASLTDALRLVARVGGVNLVLDPATQGKTLTLALHDVPWQQALGLICSTHSFGAELDGNVLRVAPISKLAQENQQIAALNEARQLSAPLTTLAFPLSWTDANAADAIIRKQLSPRGSTMIDRRTNTLFVTDVFGSPALGAFFAGGSGGSRDVPSRTMSMRVVGAVTSPIVGVRAVPAPAGEAMSGTTMSVPVGSRVEMPGAPGLDVGIEQDGSRFVLVARSGRAGAQAPAGGRQAFALKMASGAEALLVTEAAFD